jgi:hypothetical protein
LRQRAKVVAALLQLGQVLSVAHAADLIRILRLISRMLLTEFTSP